MIKWEGMRFNPFPHLKRESLLVGSLFCLYLCHCSLSIENPEEDARKKLAKVIPTTMANLEGRWDPDSTFTVDDTKATALNLSGIQLEFYPDSSMIALDTSNTSFQGKVKGRVLLAGDTLFVRPSRANASAPTDTFIVKMRFLGNYLELIHPLDQRFTFFHKHKYLDSAQQDSLLNDSLWLLKSRWISLDSQRIEPFRKDFTYLRFASNSLKRDSHKNGIFRLDSGSLVKQGKVWAWTTPLGSQELQLDMINRDTLKLWPLIAGKADSGFELYTRVSQPHPLDLDIRRILGHLRSDSIRGLISPITNHFGRFYDLEFHENHSIVTETNMNSMPQFKSWTLDSGLLWLEGESDLKVQFKIDTTKPNVLKLVTDSAKFFTSKTEIFTTKVDASKYAINPLERFPTASYTHIQIGMDTLKFYFLANYGKGFPEDFEILHLDASDSTWLTFRSMPMQESYPNGQPEFRFLMEGKTLSLGRFLCRSLPSNSMVVRLNLKADQANAEGRLQGVCHILKSGIAQADSNLVLDGTFRIQRKFISPLISSLWTQ
jgi:hypothetical protein